MNLKPEFDLADTLKKGYALIPFDFLELTTQAKHAMNTFFSKEIVYKNRFSFSEIELGYKTSENKESFVIRNSDLPSELLSCVPYFEKMSELALSCLSHVGKKLQWNEENVFSLVKNRMLPNIGKSSAILRLLSYAPNKDDACKTHEDLGLLSIIPRSNCPALKIYDFMESKWILIEDEVKSNEVIVLVGETLSAISNGYYLPATHYVHSVDKQRLSLVYQLRVDNEAILDSNLFQTDVTNVFSKPFKMTGREFYCNETSRRTSVNGSY